MPVIPKPMGRGPLFGGRAVIMFGKLGPPPKRGTSGSKDSEPTAALQVDKAPPNAPRA